MVQTTFDDAVRKPLPRAPELRTLRLSISKGVESSMNAVSSFFTGSGGLSHQERQDLKELDSALENYAGQRAEYGTLRQQHPPLVKAYLAASKSPSTQPEPIHDHLEKLHGAWQQLVDKHADLAEEISAWQGSNINQPRKVMKFAVETLRKDAAGVEDELIKGTRHFESLQSLRTAPERAANLPETASEILAEEQTPQTLGRKRGLLKKARHQRGHTLGNSDELRQTTTPHPTQPKGPKVTGSPTRGDNTVKLKRTQSF